MRILMCVVMVVLCAPFVWGQAAVTGFVGGAEYDSYYGSLGGDVVGWRFTVNAPVTVSDLGVWNADQTGGIESPHQVGIWDGSQALIASVTVDATGTVVGDWIYAGIAPVALTPGQTYTIGASYLSGDLDWYISSASSMTTDADVNWTGSCFPLAVDMGFAYPSEDSGSFGRFGPNFLMGAGDDCGIFCDGFESGDTTLWSNTEGYEPPSYMVSDGPWYTTNPPVYSCLEACALVFGGIPGDYQCSTSGVVLDNLANASTWGIGCEIVAEDYSLDQGGGYDCGTPGCSTSAYVEDTCFFGETNYCWPQ